MPALCQIVLCSDQSSSGAIVYLPQFIQCEGVVPFEESDQNWKSIPMFCAI